MDTVKIPETDCLTDCLTACMSVCQSPCICQNSASWTHSTTDLLFQVKDMHHGYTVL